jgi:hypothetical protein
VQLAANPEGRSRSAENLAKGDIGDSRAFQPSISSIEAMPVKKPGHQRLVHEFVNNLVEGTRLRSQTRKHMKSSRA